MTPAVAAFQLPEEPGGHPLKLHAVAQGLVLLKSQRNAVMGQGEGHVCRVGKGHVPQQRTQQEAGKYISRSVEGSWVSMGKGEGGFVHALLYDGDPCLRGIKGDVGDNDILGAHGQKGLGQTTHIGGGVGFTRIGLAQQKRRFGKIGHDGMRPGAKAAHLSGHCVVKERVEPAIVRKGRVHKQVSLRHGQQFDDVQHLLRLAAGSQISGIDGIKAKAKGGQMPGNGQQLIAQIQVGIPCKLAGMGAEQRCGNDGRIDACGR